MNDTPALRRGVEDIFRIKLDLLQELERIQTIDIEIRAEFEEIHGYSPIRLDCKFDTYGNDREEKYVDQACWGYLVKLFHLEKYMLCSDYNKLQKDIGEFRTPVFTIDNANAWVAGLKDLIQENVRTLVKKVFKTITEGTYRTGSSYNTPYKKRNNNGVDKRFILGTHDYQRMFEYWNTDPTVTDDLEKVCYILAGKTLPEKTIKEVMRSTKKTEALNDYFSIKVMKNGNTHYTLSDDIREKLNRYGPEGNVIGEDIKIKIVERWAS